MQTATQTVSDPGVPVVTQTMVDPGIEVSTQTFKASAEAATQTALRPRLDAATNTDYIRLADTDSISNTSEDSNLPVLEVNKSLKVSACMDFDNKFLARI